MKYLVDSDWVADWLKGRPDATQLLASLGRANLAISLVTSGEIYEGIYFGPAPKTHEQVFLQFIRSVVVLPLSRLIMRRFARIRGELRNQGQLIGDPDILIAATAVHNDLTLVTRNVKDFQRIPGLEIYQSG